MQDFQAPPVRALPEVHQATLVAEAVVAAAVWVPLVQAPANRPLGALEPPAIFRVQM
jgi:hypothetical protein